MKSLIVEDDIISQLLLKEFLSNYGATDIVVNGKEAIEAVRVALESNMPYDLICMDIMMPVMDGQTALHNIRTMEESHGFIYTQGSKIIMTTALKDMGNVVDAYKSMCDAYLLKPILKEKLVEELQKMNLI